MVKLKNNLIITVLIVLSLIPIGIFSEMDISAATSIGSQLQENNFLSVDQSITSPNGAYSAIMQGDGNFVLYNNSSQAMWATYSFGNFPVYRAAIHDDGNFVIYGINNSGEHYALWSSNTSYGAKAGYKYKLVLDNNGTLKVVRYNINTQQITGTIWSSKSEIVQNNIGMGDIITSPNRNYFAAMQDDGNFVLYSRNGANNTALWATYSVGNNYSNYIANMQTDGNLVIYGVNSNGTIQALWNSGTAIGAQAGYAFKLQLTNEGTLQILKYNVSNPSNYSIIWSSDNKILLNVPYYNQSNYGSYCYSGNYTLSKSGCIVTSIAMIHSYETGMSINPTQITNALGLTYSYGEINWGSLQNDGYYVSSSYGGATISTTILQQIYNTLKKGHPVLFYSGNHAVVITGYTGNGVSFSTSDFKINDPGYSRTILSQHISANPGLYRLAYKL